jgi:hypothetical protein
MIVRHFFQTAGLSGITEARCLGLPTQGTNETVGTCADFSKASKSMMPSLLLANHTRQARGRGTNEQLHSCDALLLLCLFR